MVKIMQLSKRLSFQPVPVQNDELLDSITGDPRRHDNQWQLHEDIDADALAHFWDQALQDLGHQDDFAT